MYHFIQRLRERPLYQRHLFVWIASVILFLSISWIWVNQIGNQLASLAPAGSVITQEKIQEEDSASYVVRIQELVDSVKDGTASLFSLFRRAKEERDVPSSLKEGDELTKFLREKGFEPFPE